MADEKEPAERKTVALTKGTWERIATYRFAQRVATEREAVQRLIDMGLRAVERRTDAAKRKAKR